MAQLYFYYSSMNAGKSTHLLQSSYNYNERGLKTVLYTAQIDDRYAKGKVTSRLGINSDAHLFAQETDLLTEITAIKNETKIACVLIDEAQFLTKTQVKQLTDIVDNLNIPVLAYGIRTDFLGQTFTGSAALLAWADKLVELKTICHCGRKANFVIRLNSDGKAATGGEQVEVGGNERYQAVCREHFKEYVPLA
ncbi:thymidine kinase [Colwellia sp. 4_MG-2023]|uniref:thymidine kinase n=1 Tax=unclassified Colwellia TaxID=196834 RepID=UPI001C09A47F|nr:MULTISPECIES: thymidine kinase [unclassified Colwellia]MBU2923381.1 thymidine kinase [Colwellia sp. C2M11]MDO6508006.1 thymidine kinase [Colwellia sp. 5_MG-2023]MDO6556813.1 thymidine kinase [Colwellia sp. 4_MG-2023]MDO6653741.1 thymidine kinase [Colwellia sp. 3_MG-2023]MDO6666629.1 thymidine kinase [Colwellia sp. 2_MG-2023]